MNQEKFEKHREYVISETKKFFKNSIYTFEAFDSYPAGYKKYYWYVFTIYKNGIGLIDDENLPISVDFIYNGKKLKLIIRSNEDIEKNNMLTIDENFKIDEFIENIIKSKITDGLF